MCSQCMTAAVSYGEVFPGFALMLATKTDYPDHPDMQEWKEGEFGLVECNDPTFYLTHAPIKDDDSEAYWKVGAQMEEDICAGGNVRAIYRLIEGAKTKGYNLEEDGIFGFWLSDYLAKYLETAQIVE